MHFSKFALPLIGLAASVNAGAAGDAVIEAMKDAGMAAVAATLDTVVQRFPILETFFDELGGGNKTFFVPSPDAFDLPTVTDLAKDPTVLLATLQYHTVQGLFEVDKGLFEQGPKHTILTTTLTNTSKVFLEQSHGQALVALKASDGTIKILNSIPDSINITRTQAVSNLNIVLGVVDGIFDLPQNLTTTLASHPELKKFPAAATKVGVLDGWVRQRGITIFVPTDAGFDAASSKFNSNDTATLTTIVNNHVVVNSTVYTNSGTTRSATGQSIQFSGDGTSVTFGGNINAKVVQGDILLDNGVMHIVDTVDVNLKSQGSALTTSKTMMAALVVTVGAYLVWA